MTPLIQTYLTMWAINCGVMDINGIRWQWALHEDPRVSNENQIDYDHDDGEEYYGPDYNFNDGDW